MFNTSEPKQLAQIALVTLLIIGCITVLLPFIGALLFALIIWVCTWESYRDRLLPRLGGRNALGASLVIILLVAISPFTRVIAGTSIGPLAASVPLSIAAIFYFARLIEQTLRDVPRVALSADAMPDRIHTAKARGFKAYLTKPLDVLALLRCLDETLSSSR